MARKSKPYIRLYPELVEKIEVAAHKWIVSKGKPNYFSRGNIEDGIREMGLEIPGHLQYFRRVIHGAIVRFRFIEGGKRMRYEQWSNCSSARSYRSYHKVPADAPIKKQVHLRAKY